MNTVTQSETLALSAVAAAAELSARLAGDALQLGRRGDAVSGALNTSVQSPTNNINGNNQISALSARKQLCTVS